MRTISNIEKAKSMTRGFIKQGLIKKSRLQELLVKAMDWKDKKFEKENQELRHQIRLLIDAIDHAYLRLDGTYGDLSYEVSDQVKYIKSMQTKELERRMEL